MTQLYRKLEHGVLPLAGDVRIEGDAEDVWLRPITPDEIPEVKIAKHEAKEFHDTCLIVEQQRDKAEAACAAKDEASIQAIDILTMQDNAGKGRGLAELSLRIEQALTTLRDVSSLDCGKAITEELANVNNMLTGSNELNALLQQTLTNERQELELPEHIAKEINDCHEELERLRAAIEEAWKSRPIDTDSQEIATMIGILAEARAITPPKP